jgi:hypothetical protein
MTFEALAAAVTRELGAGRARGGRTADAFPGGAGTARSGPGPAASARSETTRSRTMQATASSAARTARRPHWYSNEYAPASSSTQPPRLINLNAAAHPAIGSASAAAVATRGCSNRPPAPPGDQYRRRSRSHPRVYWCPPLELSARTLGRSGIGVSPMALGCWAIGGRSGPGPSRSGGARSTTPSRPGHPAGPRAGRHLDTADVYGTERSRALADEGSRRVRLEHG